MSTETLEGEPNVNFTMCNFVQLYFCSRMRSQLWPVTGHTFTLLFTKKYIVHGITVQGHLHSFYGFKICIA